MKKIADPRPQQQPQRAFSGRVPPFYIIARVRDYILGYIPQPNKSKYVTRLPSLNTCEKNNSAKYLQNSDSSHTDREKFDSPGLQVSLVGSTSMLGVDFHATFIKLFSVILSFIKLFYRLGAHKMIETPSR